MLIYIHTYNHNSVYMTVSVSYTHTYTEYMIKYVYVRYDVYTMSYRSLHSIFVALLSYMLICLLCEK